MAKSLLKQPETLCSERPPTILDVEGGMKREKKDLRARTIKHLILRISPRARKLQKVLRHFPAILLLCLMTSSLLRCSIICTSSNFHFSSFLLRRLGLWAVFYYNGSQVVLVGFWAFPGPSSCRAYGVPWAYNILQGDLYSNMLYIGLIE